MYWQAGRPRFWSRWLQLVALARYAESRKMEGMNGGGRDSRTP